MTPEITVQYATLEQCVAALATRRDAPQIEGAEITPLFGGCHNRTFKIDCDGQSFVARVAEEKESAQLAQCFESLQSLSAYALDDLGPQPILLRPPVLVMSFMDGSTYESLADLTENEANALGRTVARLHRVRRDNLQGKTHKDFILGMLQRTVTDRLTGLDVSAHPELTEGKSLLEAKIQTSGELFTNTHESWLHGDLSCGNILWKNDQPRFIDWEPRFGDPAQELDYVMNNAGNDMSGATGETFLRAYRQAGGDDRAILRLPLYQLANALDDLAWAIERRHFAEMFPERSPQDAMFYQTCISSRQANLRTAIARTIS